MADPASHAAAEPQPQPQPHHPLTSPILAFQMLSSRLQTPGIGEKVRVDGGAAGAGLDLDQYALLGGVERGEVVGVSSGGGVGRLISLHLLATFLFAHSTSHASIIDTTGSFPISLLASVLRYRLVVEVSRSNSAVQSGGADRRLDEEVLELLSRVAISRVFDLEGVCEVVGEVGSEWREWERKKEEDRLGGGAVAYRRCNSENKLVQDGQGARQEAVLEIGDSQDEEEDDEDEGGDEVHQEEKRCSGSRQRAPAEMIVVDDMTTPISGLFSQREKGAAHALLAALSRTISTLSAQRNILTVLLSDITTPPLQQNQQPQHETKGQTTNAPPNYYATYGPPPPKSRSASSIFATTAARPALGRLFSDLLSLHLLISPVPKTQQDAEELFAGSAGAGDRDGGSDDDNDDGNNHDGTVGARGTSSRDGKGNDQGKPNGKVINYAYVLEVLKDETSDLASWVMERKRDGELGQGLRQQQKQEQDQLKRTTSGRTPSREQRWSAFVLHGEVGLRDAFAAEKTAPEAAKGTARYADGTAVHVLKQFPMGRRG